MVILSPNVKSWSPLSLLTFPVEVLQFCKVRFAKYKPRYSIEINRGNYVVKTAETPVEVEKALRLRHEVFYREMLNWPQLTGLDIDKFDAQCDHLILMEKSSGQVVGTYRLNLPKQGGEYYSATEFELDDLLSLEGSKLELGRACIRKDHRTGAAISMLWKGLGTYFKTSGAKYLFGCSSVKTVDLYEVSHITRYLLTNYKSELQIHAKPLPAFEMPRFGTISSAPSKEIDVAFVKSKIPPLLFAYLKAGAAICSTPALDRRFQCVDFLTLLDVQKLDKKMEQRFA